MTDMTLSAPRVNVCAVVSPVTSSRSRSAAIARSPSSEARAPIGRGAALAVVH
jgi:hypothetical protein